MAKAKTRAQANKELNTVKQADTSLATQKSINKVKVATIYDGYYIRPNLAVGMITAIDDWVGIDEQGNRVYLTGADTNKVIKANKADVYIKSPEHLMTLYLEFLKHIRDNKYNVYPTKANLSDFIGISYSSLCRYLSDYKSDFKPLYDNILADILTEGVISGAYDRQMTMFCLKNWCGWADNTKIETTTRQEPISKDKADKILKEYISSLDKAE
jgi:hypothetical protein|nr:MAG TPA: DNA-packaging protein small subunit [Caudoviricetes sp.]